MGELVTDPARSAEEVGRPAEAAGSSRTTGVLIGGGLLVGAAMVAALRQQAWEYGIVMALNAHARHSTLFDRTVHALTTRDLLQGVVFVTLIWFMWFGTTAPEQRVRLLTGSVAAALAGIVSRLMQIALPTHLRPLHTQALGFVLPVGVEPDALNHFNSFPSDHGAVYFTLALVTCRMRPGLGIAALFWAMIVDSARVYDGYHFPSDVVGSIGLGILMLALFDNGWCERAARGALAFEQSHRPWFYTLAFLACYQIATLFDDVREIGRGLSGVLLHHDPFGGG